ASFDVVTGTEHVFSGSACLGILPIFALCRKAKEARLNIPGSPSSDVGQSRPAAPSPVAAAGISAQEPLDARHQIGLRRLEHKIKMVCMRQYASIRILCPLQPPQAVFDIGFHH